MLSGVIRAVVGHVPRTPLVCPLELTSNVDSLWSPYMGWNAGANMM